MDIKITDADKDGYLYLEVRDRTKSNSFKPVLRTTDKKKLLDEVAKLLNVKSIKELK
jgi:hypothetical protein